MTMESEWPSAQVFAELDIIDAMEAIEYDEVTESIRRFDIARNEVYLQTIRLMLGGGGDTAQEAVSVLSKLRTHAATVFGSAGEALWLSSESDMEAARLITNVYKTDLMKRHAVLSKLNPKASYATMPDDDKTAEHEFMAAVLEALDDTDEADEDWTLADELYHLYDEELGEDVDACITTMPHNKAELHAVDIAIRREALRNAARKVGKIVGGAAITLTIASLARRKLR